MNRSTISLGIVFLALPAISVAGAPGVRLSPVAYGLLGLLGLAGVLVMFRLRPAYYLGLAAGAATAMTGILTWAGVGGGRFALPGHPAFSTVVGLYLCLRVAMAHRQFLGAPEEKSEI
jgi:hypothetical protein